MKPLFLYVISSVLVLLLSSVTSLPVQFADDRNPHEQGRSLQQHEEGRIFHAHAIKKRKKKKLLHCLLNLQRSNSNGDPRTLFFNYLNLEYTVNGGHSGYNDNNGGGGYNNCFNQFGGGGSNGGDDGDSDSSGLGGIGEGINNLSSLVGQVGQVPGDLVGSVGDGIKPVFENPERYLNRYIIRPLYRSLRPLYRWF